MSILVPILLAFLVATLVASAVQLWLIGRTLGAAKSSFPRALLIVSVGLLVGILATVGTLLLFGESATDETSGVVSLVLLGAGILQIVVTVGLIMGILGATAGRGILIWLLHAVANTALAMVVIVALRAAVVQAYTVPTNAMAPAIVGWHRSTDCPFCGKKLVVGAPAPGDPFADRLDRDLQEVPGICVNCRTVSKLRPLTTPVLGPDRVLVSQLAKPERWDIMAFRFPRDPTQKWIFRLVGLPGETVLIKEGAIWINGARQDLPSELVGTYYHARLPFGEPDADPEGKEYPLGAGEYFVLGDFPERSSDSRDWGPVPANHIEGVVSAIYWPPARWRALK